MRPLAISMQAFGPFPDKADLDLRQLSFFLIHGPTGAGKTTILDAMCFALYGVTSGAERDGRQMRSHLAKPDTLTEVRLDFSLGGRIYRIFRKPEQERPKLRGEGMTKEKAEATLWDCTNAGDDDEGRVVETGWSKVTDKVIEILGCDSDQFRQVIVLPQGQFRKLLLADSKDRQAILETLFEAEKYRRVQRLLKDAAGKVRDDVRHWRERLDNTLRQASVDGIPPLEDLIREMNAESERMEAGIVELRNVETKAMADLDKGRKDADQLKALETAEKFLADLMNRQGEMNAKADILARAKRAVLVKAAETEFQKRLNENRSAKQRLTESEKALRESETRLAQAEINLATETARDPERDAVRKQINDLESLLPRAKALHDLERQANQARQEAESAAKNEITARQALEAAENQISDLEKSLDETRPLANDLAAIKVSSQSLTKSLEKVRRTVDLKSDIADRQKLLETKAEELSEAEGALNIARANYETCDQQWRAGRAAALAADLGPGQPCPVCGSTHHPSLAQTENKIPSDRDLDLCREAVKAAEKNFEKVRKDHATADLAMADLQARLTALAESLEDSADADPAALESRVKEASQALARAEAAAESVKQLETKLAAVKTELGTLKKDFERTQTNRQQAEKNQAEKTAALQQALSGIPEDLRDESVVEKALVDSKAALTEMEKALTDARENESRARNDVSARKASVAEITAQVSDSGKHVNMAEQALSESLGKTGFKNMDDFRAACLSDDDMDEMETAARKYETDCATAQTRVNELRESTRGVTPPDIPALEASHQKARSDLEIALSQMADLNARKDQHRTWLRDARQARSKLDALENEYGVVGHLADVAAGTAHDNQYNLAFQNFVLAALLDDVLAAATMRFRIMSRGRYQLIRSVRGRDGRKTWGLDLAVLDEYTGQERAVATLSGGESFLAALALALGLADVVQAYAGGIHLEAVFVDEGFGSLDPEALDLALRALTDLHQSGRMVGIISHVPELRECIDSRLEVTGGRSGSTARVIHP